MCVCVCVCVHLCVLVFVSLFGKYIGFSEACQCLLYNMVSLVQISCIYLQLFIFFFTITSMKIKNVTFHFYIFKFSPPCRTIFFSLILLIERHLLLYVSIPKDDPVEAIRRPRRTMCTIWATLLIT